jgi:hypothetical protein
MRKLTLIIIYSLYLPLLVHAITILTHAYKIYWFFIYSALVLYFYKTQSLFKKGSGFLITLFVSNISWLTFIAACYYGFKNFEIYNALIGVVFSVILVHLGFARINLFINSKFKNKGNLIKIKTTIEYLIILAFIYYIFV